MPVQSYITGWAWGADRVLPYLRGGTNRHLEPVLIGLGSSVRCPHERDPAARFAWDERLSSLRDLALQFGAQPSEEGNSNTQAPQCTAG